MNRDELLALPAVIALWPTAGRAWGMGKTATYEAAARGDFPCQVRRLGNRWVVVTEQLLTSLEVRRTPDSREDRGPTESISTTQASKGPMTNAPLRSPEHRTGERTEVPA